MEDKYHPSQTVHDVEDRPYQVAFLEAIRGQLVSQSGSVVSSLILVLETRDLPAKQDRTATHRDWCERHYDLNYWLAWVSDLPVVGPLSERCPCPYRAFWPSYLEPHQTLLKETFAEHAEVLVSQADDGYYGLDSINRANRLLRSLLGELDTRIPDAIRPVVHRPARGAARFNVPLPEDSPN